LGTSCGEFKRKRTKDTKNGNLKELGYVQAASAMRLVRKLSPLILVGLKTVQQLGNRVRSCDSKDETDY
jgi:hypothetical protein